MDRLLCIFLLSLAFCLNGRTDVHFRVQNQLYTKQKKKVKMGLAAEGEVRQTTAKSKCSQFKKEMGNITCLDRAFACAVQPLSIGSFSSIFMANSSVWKLHKYLLNP